MFVGLLTEEDFSKMSLILLFQETGLSLEIQSESEKCVGNRKTGSFRLKYSSNCVTTDVE